MAINVPNLTFDSPLDGIGGTQVGGTLYEIFGVATVETTDSLNFTLISNIPIDGIPSNAAQGGEVAWGDLIINFGGDTLNDPNSTLFGVRFSPNNESGALGAGLYRDITVTDVVEANSGPIGGLAGYIDSVTNAGQVPDFGDLGNSPTPYFELDEYVPNVIDDPGTKIADITIAELTITDVSALGIDISSMVPVTNPHPLQLINIDIPKADLPGGDFTAHIAPECDNDIVVVTHQIVPDPSITLEKLTNGVDADILADAAVVAAGELVTWQYHLTNDGNIDFSLADIAVVDDKGVLLELDLTSDMGGDGILSPDEQWTYIGKEIAKDLSFEIDFERDADGNDLLSGDTIDLDYQGMGVTISTPGHEYGAMIFDTAHVTGQDRDLSDPALVTGDETTADERLGNVLILSEDGDGDDADDNAEGGIFRFDFDALVGVSGVHLFDIDVDETVEIRTFDAAGQISGTQLLNGVGNNLRQTAVIDSGLIAVLEIELSGSGAITGLEGDRFYVNTATATIDGFPDTTASDVSHYVNTADSSVFS